MKTDLVMANDKSSLHHQTLAARKRAERITKRCARCKKWKSRLSFNKNRTALDGLKCYCKPCTARLAGAYRKSDKGKEAVRAYRRKYRLKNAEKLRESNRKRSRKRRLKNPEKLNAYSRKYRTDNPDKCRARLMITNRIHRGKIVRGSCEVCGESNAEAHHPDYSKPLSVRWFCTEHHNLYHSKFYAPPNLEVLT